MEKIVVVIVILAICFVIYFLCIGNKKGLPAGKQQPEGSVPAPAPAPQQPAKSDYEDIGTRLVSKLRIEQIGSNGRVIKSFEKNNIPPEGLTVSRPGAKLGDIILSADGGEDAMTVGTESIVIAEDEKGMFGKIFDNGREKNKLYLYDPVTNKSKEVTQFDIANNTLICIGRQWLRFVIPTVPGAPVPGNGLSMNTPRDVAAPASSQATQAPTKPMQPSAPSGFSFDSSVDDKGRFVISRK